MIFPELTKTEKLLFAGVFVFAFAALFFDYLVVTKLAWQEPWSNLFLWEMPSHAMRSPAIYIEGIMLMFLFAFIWKANVPRKKMLIFISAIVIVIILAFEVNYFVVSP